MKATRAKIHGQASYVVRSPEIEFCVTEVGGHLAPVTFDRGGKQWQPFSISPWAEEKVDPTLPNLLKVLRGDFFCLPFGGNDVPWRGEVHPPHGETANNRWAFESLSEGNGATTLHLSMDMKTRAGRVDKKIQIRDGQNVVYQEHTVSGMSGPMNPGHHPVLRFPDEPGSGRLSVSPFVYGQVLPTPFERPEARGYSFLKTGAPFTSLSEVPTITGETADLSVYPARRGFEDLVMMVCDDTRPFAWTAVVFPKLRAAWFALKDPRILRETIFWISNGGRHFAPWNGRHVNVMGLEEVTSYFHYGLAQSAGKNPIAAMGYPTCLQLDKKKPLRIPYMVGMVKLPAGFDRVATIEAADGDHAIELTSDSGKVARAKVDLGFLRNAL